MPAKATVCRWLGSQSGIFSLLVRSRAGISGFADEMLEIADHSAFNIFITTGSPACVGCTSTWPRLSVKIVAQKPGECSVSAVKDGLLIRDS
jgi:hypothetical protein